MAWSEISVTCRQISQQRPFLTCKITHLCKGDLQKNDYLIVTVISSIDFVLITETAETDDPHTLFSHPTRDLDRFDYCTRFGSNKV